MNSPSPRSGEKTGFGLYIHIPFCRTKCPYCDFYSLAGGKAQIPAYLKALRLQARQMAELAWCGPRCLETVFFGGGTPTLADPSDLAELLELCRHLFRATAPEIETTIEVNPATVDSSGLQRLRRSGFNRISIGLQSLEDELLRRIGRVHTAAQGRECVRDARRAGFTDMNLDLIYGLPGQDPDTWQHTLEQALELEPDHLSLYELTVEEGTPLARQVAANRLTLPREETVLEMMARTAILTEKSGFTRYEISNYARPGHQCRHNLNYWHNGSYIGLGAAAVSCLSGRRLMAVADLQDYCCRLAGGDSPWVEEEQLGHRARFRETVIMGLRMIEGISRSAMIERFGIDPVTFYGKRLEQLARDGLIFVHQDRIRLSDQGLRLANQVMARLV